MKNENRRFLVAYTEGSAFVTDKTIYVDKETGAQYLFVQAGYAGGLTPLLDSDGKPMVMPKDEIEQLIEKQ